VAEVLAKALKKVIIILIDRNRILNVSYPAIKLIKLAINESPNKRLAQNGL
jgi:hypothetical protein